MKPESRFLNVLGALMSLVIVANTCIAQIVSIPTPFEATHVFYSDAEQKLLLWCSGGTSELAIIDIESKEVVVRKTIDTQLVTAAIIDSAVYVLQKTSTTVAVSKLDLTTLSPVLQRNIPIVSTVRAYDDSMFAKQGDVLKVQSLGGKTRRAFQFANLEMIESTPEPALPKSDRGAAGGQPTTMVDMALAGFQAPPTLAPSLSPPLVSYNSARSHFSEYDVRKVKQNSNNIRLKCHKYPVRFCFHWTPEAVPGFSRLELDARSLKSNELIRRWQVALIDPKSRRDDFKVSTSTEGSVVAILDRRMVYLCDISALDKRLLSRPLVVTAAQRSLVSANEITPLKFTVQGGQSPMIGSVFLGTGREVTQVVKEKELAQNHRELTYELDPTIFLEKHIEQISTDLVQWSGTPAMPDAMRARYLDAVAAGFESKTGRAPSGIPVSFGMLVEVEDDFGDQAHQIQSLIFDLPWDKIEIPLCTAIAKQWPDSEIATAALARKEVLESLVPSEEMLEFVMNFEYSRRRSSKASDVSKRHLESSLAQAEEYINRRIEFKLGVEAKFPIRQWEDVEGNQVRAQFVSLFAGKVTLKSNDRTTLVLELARLIEEDQKYAQLCADAVVMFKKKAADPQLRSEIRREILVDAVESFKRRYKRYPPPALLDDSGNPTLSWRVLLLPYLGARQLYEYFHIDEPWDSNHNRRLLEYMPSVFKVHGLENTPHHTSIVRPWAVHSFERWDDLINESDVIDGLEKTVFAVTVNRQEAVPWTQPGRFHVDAEGSFAERLNWADGQTSVLMCDGKLRNVPRTTKPSAWLRAIVIDDDADASEDASQDSEETAAP